MELGSAPVQMAEVAKALLASNTPPKSEAPAAAVGGDDKASRADHTHPTISWRGRVTLGVDGTATVNFGRTFAVAPVILLGAINPTGARVVVEQMADIKTGALWTGATISGSRARPLPVLEPVTGLLTAVIAGINVVTNALSGFNLFSQPASGVVVNVWVAEPSPPP